MKLLYVSNKEVAKYKKGGWVMKSELRYPGSDDGALMLRLETLEEYEKWDFKNKCVRQSRH